MRLNKKNLIYLFLIIFIFTLHQFIFLDFFPNSKNRIGPDYEYFLPNFLYGKIWFKNNFLSIPWFSPSFCCGTPFYPDPQNMFYSVQQIFFILFEPIFATKLMFSYFSLIGYLGTFLLLRKRFNFSFESSFLGSVIFLFNGFFVYRSIIGHVAYINFTFIPIYCFFLFGSINAINKFKGNIYLIISSIILSSLIYSGSGPILSIIVIIIFSISIIFYLHKKNIFLILKKLILSLFLTILFSLSKIISSLIYLSNFERVYPSIYFENIIDFLKFSFTSLFLFPSVDFFNNQIINGVTRKLFVHELEYGLSIIPLLLFFLIILKFNYFKIYFKNIRYLIIFIFLLSIPILFNTDFFNFQNAIKNIPIIKSSWVQIRWLSFYILPVIFLSVFIFDKAINRKYRIHFSIFFISIIFIQNLYYDKSYYDNQNYNPSNMVNLFYKINQDKNVKIEAIGTIVNSENKIFNNGIRNDFFSDNISSLFCYQPIFGYSLEKFPKDKLILNKKIKLKNSNLLIGDLKISKNGNENFNFLNPSCLIFPNANDCKAGDLFKVSDENNFKNFINYKKINFKKNKLQIISDIITLISLVLFIVLLILNIYFYKKK